MSELIPTSTTKSAEQYHTATVTHSDVASSRGRGRQQCDQAALVARVHGYVGIASDYVAQACAAQPLRLYRRGGKTDGKDFRGRRVSKAHARRLFLQRGHLAGTKAISYADDAEDMVEVTEHEALDLLRRGNDSETGEQLTYLRFVSGQVTGNAYLHIDRKTVESFVLRPHWTRLAINEDGRVEGCWYGAEFQREEFLEFNEFIHFKHTPSLDDAYYGVGPLHRCFQAHDIHTHYRDSEEARAENGGMPAHFFKLPEASTPDHAKQYAEMIQAEYGAPHRQGRTWAGNAEPIPMQFTPREMEYLEGLQDLERQVFAAFHLPEPYIRLNDANLASSREGHLQFARLAVLPVINRDADKLTEELLPMLDVEPGEMWFAYDNPVPEDEAEKTTRIQGLHSAGIITVNEARAEMGLEPIEGGDTLASQQPEPQANPFAGMFLSAKDAAPVVVNVPAPRIEAVPQSEAPQNEAKQAEPEPYPEPCECASCDTLPAKKPCERDNFDTLPDRKARIKAAKRTYELIHTKDDDDDDRAEPLDRELRRARRLLQGAVAQFYTQDLVDRLTLGDTVSFGDAEQILAEAVRPILEDVFKATAEDAAREVGVDVSFDVIPERAIEAIERSTTQFASSVTQSETDRINAKLRDGLEKGESIDEIRDAIVNDPQTGLRGDRGKAQAERIARTELAEATTQGKQQGWLEAGVTEMEWLLSPNPCPQCAGFAKQFSGHQKVGEPFLAVGGTYTDADGKTQEITFRDVKGPPLHPGCVLPGTPVSACGIVAGFRAWLDGEVIELGFANGDRLTVTPNHKVLTPAGLVEAGKLSSGDDVIRSLGGEGPTAGDPDDHHRPALIEDVFASLSMSGGMTTARVPVSSEHFHGDGRFMQGHVDVVAADGLLERHGVAPGAEGVTDLPLCAGWSDARLASLGYAASVFVGLSLAAHGVVSGGSETLALLGSRLAHPCEHCGRTVSDLDAVAGEAASDGASRHAGALGQSLDGLSSKVSLGDLGGPGVSLCEPGLTPAPNADAALNERPADDVPAVAHALSDACERFAGLVSADRLVSVNRRAYSGHVYDLQTESGLYVGNGILTSNCRCAVVAVID